MPLTPKQNLRSQDHNSLELTEVLKVQLLQDAANSDEAVRLSQAQALSSGAAQDILITDPNLASNTTAYTSLTMNTLLSAKQDNLSVHPDSIAFVEIVDGTKINIKRLTTNEVAVDSTSTDLATALAAATYNGDGSWTINAKPIQEGDTLVLTNTTSAQERSWVHNGGSAGDATDFTRLQTNYDEAAIRAMFSAGDFISYDAASGVISVKYGLGGTDLGAQTLPATTTGWQVINPSQPTTLSVLLALEQLIINVDQSGADGTAALTARINALIGVTGNNLGIFNEGIFPDNEDVKDVLQASETLIKNNQEAINAETQARINGDATLQTNLDAEANTRQAKDDQLTFLITTEIADRQQGDAALQANIDAEANTRKLADDAIEDRLDIMEGDDTTVGSIAKAEKDAKDYADAAVANEAQLRATADANLQTQINALQSAFDYKGIVKAGGVIETVDVASPNNGVLFQNASFQTGDFYKVNADLTITFNGGSSIDVTTGDGLVAITDVAATAAVASNFQKFDNTEASDILREGMLDGTTIEKTGAGVVQVVPGGIGTTQLSSDVVDDINDSFKKSLSNQSITGDRTLNHITDVTNGPSFNMYFKRTSNNAAASTGTQRVLLLEHTTKTIGSGDPSNPCIADVITASMTYDGNCQDGSVLITAANFEANGKVGTNVLATGAFGRADQPHNGLNAGLTGQAENAAISNVGLFGYGKVGGVGNDRGVFGAISNLASIEAYAVYRALNPIPYTDAAGIFDADKNLTDAGNKAIVANGDSVFYGGELLIPSAFELTGLTDGDKKAISLGDLKSKEFQDTVTVNAVSEQTITHSLDTTKIAVQVWYNDEDFTSSFAIKRVGNNQITLGNSTGNTYTDVEVLIYALS